MSWTTGLTPFALYVSLIAVSLCLWPGLIQRQPDATIKRWFWRMLAANALIFYCLLFCDLVLLYIFPGHPFWDHARRLGARWAWVALYGTLAWQLWHVADHLPPWRRGILLGICLGGSLLLTGTVGLPERPLSVPSIQAAPARIWANPRSFIYHLPGCRSYRGDRPEQEYVMTEDQAQAQGYRKAKNCPSTVR